MWNPKNKTDERTTTITKTRNRLINAENKLVARREVGGSGG